MLNQGVKTIKAKFIRKSALSQLPFVQFSSDVKMDGSVLQEKSSFKMLGATFSSWLDWGSYIISIA